MVAPALILAAGAGRRMGGPKALLAFEGRTCLEWVVDACREGGADPIALVHAAHAGDVSEAADRLALTTVVNPTPELGMFSSVQHGLARLLDRSPDACGFILVPVDHPRITGATVAALRAALTSDRGLIWIRPTFEGRPGHPIAISRALAQSLLDERADQPLSDVLRSLGAERRDLPVPDAGILANLNRPQDL